MAKETKLPAIPHSTDPAVKALKEALEVRLGRRGDSLDRAVTVRDLYEGGVISLSGMPTLPTIVTGGGDITPTVVVDDNVDLSVPPAPTTLVANGAFVGILVHWDITTRTDLTAHIYRNTVDDRSTAVVIGTAAGHIYSDLVGYGKTYYYWVRLMSVAQILGPFNAVAGTIGVTSLKVSDVIAELSDELNQSHLAGVLSTKIDKIDVIEGGLATVVSESAALVATTATLNTTVGTHSSTIQNHTSSLNGISAENYVKIDLGANAISGYGLAAGPSGSEFAVLADSFKISNSSGSKIVPFFVQGGTTYIKSAMIADASIDMAKIGNLTVDMADVTGTLTANHVSAINVTSNMIQASVSLSSPIISAGTITSASIYSSYINGGVIEGVLILSGAVGLVTDYGNPHYGYDGGVVSDVTATGNSTTTAARLNIKPYNYYQTAAPVPHVKNPASAFWRYRRQHITPQISGSVVLAPIGGLINSNPHTNIRHCIVRITVKQSPYGGIDSWRDFEIRSFNSGDDETKTVTLTATIGYFYYTLTYQYRTETGTDGWTTYYYHRIVAHTLTFTVTPTTAVSFNENTSTGYYADVSVLSIDANYCNVGTRSIRIWDTAENAY